MKNKNCDTCNGPCIYGPAYSMNMSINIDEVHIIDNNVYPGYCTKCNGECQLDRLGSIDKYINRLKKAYTDGCNSIGTLTADDRGLDFMKLEMYRIIQELEEKGY